MKKMRVCLAGFAVAALSLSVMSLPVFADDQMANANCTQAEAMLEKAVSTKIPTLMTGNVDKDFATLMMAHEKVGRWINDIEAKCGKDPKMKSIASKNAIDGEERMAEFRNLGMSQ